MCEKLLANPLVEDYEVQLLDGGLDLTHTVKFGVLQFPGSCDEVDALRAARRVGDAELMWHAERDLRGADAIVVPGGFSYGDYLRAGAIARFSPAMESVIEFARAGGLVLGICNGFQVLCEAHLLPGALLPNANLRFTSRQVALEVVARRHRLHARVRAAASLSIPAKHSWGRYYADETHARRAGGQRSGGAALRARARTSTARCATSPASATRRATCSA